MDTATTALGRASPWNIGKLLGQKPPLRLKEIWAIRIRLQLVHRTRDLALFNLAINTMRRTKPDADLSADQESPSRSIAAWAHQA